MSDGILVLRFFMVLTKLSTWDKALTIIDPYESRDDVESDVRCGVVRIYSITEEEARSLLDLLKGIDASLTAAWFEDYDEYYCGKPKWEVRS